MFSTSLLGATIIFNVNIVSEESSEILYTFPMNIYPNYAKGDVIRIKNNGIQAPSSKPWISLFKVKSVAHNIMITYEVYKTIEYDVDVIVETLEENWGA